MAKKVSKKPTKKMVKKAPAKKAECTSHASMLETIQLKNSN